MLNDPGGAVRRRVLENPRRITERPQAMFAGEQNRSKVNRVQEQRRKALLLASSTIISRLNSLDIVARE